MRPMKLIGYARVSTRDQTAAPQREALRAAGCATIFEDTMSGASRHRSGLDQALGQNSMQRFREVKGFYAHVQ